MRFRRIEEAETEADVDEALTLQDLLSAADSAWRQSDEGACVEAIELIYDLIDNRRHEQIRLLARSHH